MNTSSPIVDVGPRDGFQPEVLKLLEPLITPLPSAGIFLSDTTGHADPEQVPRLFTKQ